MRPCFRPWALPGCGCDADLNKRIIIKIQHIMNVTQNKIDDLNIELELSISGDDYSAKRKKKLNEHKRTAEIKGFRKGMVPMGLIEKIYGQSCLVDAVNDLISEALNGFISDNGLKVIGEPLPSENQPETEWKNGNDFSFKFDIALAPKIDFDLSKDDQIPYYNINITKEAKAEMKENLLKQYGSLEEGKAAKAEDFIIVDLEQGETRVEGTYIALRNVAEAVRPSFTGLKAGDSIDVNVNEAFVNETDRASLLKTDKDKLADMDPVYRMTVKNVKTFVPAPMTQETFDKIFGEGNVKSEEEFDAKIEERLAAEYSQESEFRFAKDAKDYLVAKAAISLPEKFLKRWIFVANDGKFTMEDIEKEFDLFLSDYRWQMVRNYLMEKYSVKIEEADLMASAKGLAAYQFAMYGINNVPDAELENYAKNILSQEKEGRRVLEQVEDTKTIAAVKGAVTVKNHKISVEKFRELK